VPFYTLASPRRMSANLNLLCLSRNSCTFCPIENAGFWGDIEIEWGSEPRP
jgi:hypothetical protein